MSDLSLTANPDRATLFLSSVIERLDRLAFAMYEDEPAVACCLAQLAHEIEAGVASLA